MFSITLGKGLIGTTAISALVGIGYLALDGAEMRVTKKADARYLPVAVAEAEYMQLETYRRLKGAEDLRALRREYNTLSDLTRKLDWIATKRTLTDEQEWVRRSAIADMADTLLEIEQIRFQLGIDTVK